jgi:hypothetical protein
MHMRGPNVNRQQPPIALSAMLLNGLQHNFPPLIIQPVSRLPHILFFRHHPTSSWRKKWAAGDIMARIHRYLFVSMQPCAVAGERNQVG